MEPKRFTKYLQCKLEPNELATTAAQMARVGAELGGKRLELEGYKARVKKLPDEIAALETDLLPLCETYSRGTEERPVEVEEQPDYEAKVVRLMRLDTHELLPEFERAMTAKERYWHGEGTMFDPENPIAETAETDAVGETETTEAEPVEQGTPARTLLTAAEMDNAAWFWEHSPLGGGDRFALFYLDKNPYVVTNVVYGEPTAEATKPVAKVQAWSVLPLENVGDEPVREAYSEEHGWQNVMVSIGEAKWVLVNPASLWTLAPPEPAEAVAVETEEMGADVSAKSSPKDLALFHALMRQDGAKGRWEAFRKAGKLDDSSLSDAIRGEFGSGGSGMEISGVSFAVLGGDVPKFWFGKVEPKGTPTLQGKALLERARAVMNLPKPAKVTKSAKPASKAAAKQTVATA